MVREIHDATNEREQAFLEAARSLGAIWLQAFSRGSVTAQFRESGDVSEGELFFLADTFNYELREKQIENGPWIKYYFE